jgi:hypothetical protein
LDWNRSRVAVIAERLGVRTASRLGYLWVTIADARVAVEFSATESTGYKDLLEPKIRFEVGPLGWRIVARSVVPAL